MIKNRKMIFFIITIAVIASIIGGFIFYQNQKNYVFVFGLGEAVLLDKGWVNENGKQIMVLTIIQKYNMDEYTFRVGIYGNQERQNLIYNMLLIDGTYGTAEYRFEIPKEVARQYELSSADVMDINKIIDIPELMTQEYMKLVYLWE